MGQVCAERAASPAVAMAAVPPKMGVEGLNLYYRDFHALKDINLNFPANKVTALIGPSGCGKSTLLKTLNRMNDLVEGCRVEGRITLDHDDAYHGMAATELRRRVGMVFQQPNPFPMSVYDNVAFGPRTHGVRDRQELDRIVEKSLRQAAIWDELKDRLKKNAWAFRVASSSACALRAPWPLSPRCCSWTSRRAPSTPSPRQRSRSSWASSSATTRSSW